MRLQALFALALAACSTPTPAPRDAATGEPAASDVPDASDAYDVSDVGGDGGDGRSTCPTCPSGYALAAPSGRVTAPSLDELSGVVESRRVPGVFFVHNDSGDGARFFAVNLAGEFTAEYRLRGATATDWEGITIGPCATGDCLYLADIGDNEMARVSYTVYRVAEPAPPSASAVEITPQDLAWEPLPFRYPDGAHNAEAIAAHPSTGDLYVITKTETGPSEVFALRAPWNAREIRVAARVGELELPVDSGQLVTGADIHPCAPRLLVRTYLRVYEYTISSASPFDDIFGQTPERLPVAPERQGEAVGWRLDGRGYVTVSEGTNVAFNRYACSMP